MSTQLVVAILCSCALMVVYSLQARGGPKPDRRGQIVGLGIGLLAWLASSMEVLGPWSPPVFGFLFGLAGALLILDFPDSEWPSALAVSLVCALVVGSFVKATPQETQTLLAMLTGASAGAGLLAIFRRSLVAGRFVALGAATLCAVVLGSSLAPTEVRSTVMNIITAGLLALLVGEGLTWATRSSTFKWPRLGTALIFGVMAFFVSVRTTEFPDLPLAVGGSALVAVILAVVNQGSSGSTAAVLVGALVWLGASTAAFSFGRGYGLALAALTGLSASLIAGEKRTAVWMSPIFALCLYRLARLIYPDTSRAFDIGQHYAIVGLCVGLIVPLLLIESGRSLPVTKSVIAVGSGALSGLAALVGVATAIAFLGPKGASGMVIGFALSPLLSSLKGEASNTAMPIGIGLSCWSIVSIGVFAAEEDLARPEKVQMVLVLGGIVAILTIAAWLLARQKREVVAA